MLKVGDLNPYEKGILARWLLGELIERGCVEKEGPGAFDISINVAHWQLKLLAQFCKGDEAIPDTSQQSHLDLGKLLSQAQRSTSPETIVADRPLS